MRHLVSTELQPIRGAKTTSRDTCVRTQIQDLLHVGGWQPSTVEWFDRNENSSIGLIIPRPAPFTVLYRVCYCFPILSQISLDLISTAQRTGKSALAASKTAPSDGVSEDDGRDSKLNLEEQNPT